MSFFSWEPTEHLSENHGNNITHIFRATENYVEIVNEVQFWLESNDQSALKKKKSYMHMALKNEGQRLTSDLQYVGLGGGGISIGANLGKEQSRVNDISIEKKV